MYFLLFSVPRFSNTNPEEGNHIIFSKVSIYIFQNIITKSRLYIIDRNPYLFIVLCVQKRLHAGRIIRPFIILDYAVTFTRFEI